ncbi:hypothetical protein CBF34_02835 [Vagococcus penaei]|uniref:Uncharacterized protein n=1 Tax=Vagococcus penaei TaxID=633807 RepID=A0A1Q2D3X9_9ENTE|nr:polysaccharide deacetylase family protein [Vagococcus penaei]AQP53072.1 hypothetical protein BW732_01750 [Vagococcus penaei]RSU06065.1 hypothetical protein CBF34_02835 [Vagococcus penaei]
MKKWIWLVSILLIVEVMVVGMFLMKNRTNSANQIKNKSQQETKLIEVGSDGKMTTDTSSDSISDKQKKEKPDTSKWLSSETEIAFPILMYHSLTTSTDGNTLKVPPAEFKEHLKWLKDNGYYTLSTEEAYLVLTEQKKPADKIVWITLDDGYLNNFEAGFPALKENNQHATINYITSKMGSDNYFNLDQMKEMADSSIIDIQSHTVNHLELNTLSDEQIKTELTDSMAFLNKNLDQQTLMICYPVGRYDERVVQIAQETGYKLALTTEPGLARQSDGLFALKRVRINPGLSGEMFGQTITAYQ